VKIFTRRGHDWTNRFKKIAGDTWQDALIGRQHEVRLSFF
jgi:ATP-dependent DNA ligase